MSIRVDVNNPTTTVTIYGCTGSYSSGCMNFRNYTWDCVDRRVNFVARLAIEVMFNRSYNIDSIISRVEYEYNNPNRTKNTDIFTITERVILEKLEKNKTWKTCPACKKEYREDTRAFEHILFITPSKEYCIDHEN